MHYERFSLQGRLFVYLNKELFGLSIRLADLIVFPGPGLARSVGVEESDPRIRVAPFITDKTFFEDFGLFVDHDKRKRLVGFVGSLRLVKGVDQYVKSIPIVLNRIRGELTFLIVGDGPLLQEIEASLRDSGASMYTKVAGRIDHKKLGRTLNQMKLLVVPSFTEGLPSVVIEAMACGTPVLSTRVGSIPALITDGVTGFFLDSPNPESIAEKVADLLGREELLREVGLNGSHFIRTNYSVRNTRLAWEKVLGGYS